MPDFDHEVMLALQQARRQYAIQKGQGTKRPDWKRIVHKLAGSSCLVDSTGKTLETAVMEEADKASQRRRPNEEIGPEYFGGRYKRYARPRR